MLCVFFGHRDTPSSVKPKIEAAVRGLIAEEGAEMFYVGMQGTFDRMVTNVLVQLAEEYPHISCNIVLERYPEIGQKEYALPTILADDAYRTPARFALLSRNRWMAKMADVAIVYAIWPGGAMKAVEYMKRLGKRVINLAETEK